MLPYVWEKSPIFVQNVGYGRGRQRVTIRSRTFNGARSECMANQRVLRFPAGFLWGTATSSYQCEGGNTNNQWYRWEQEGHILTGEQCALADNWWQNAEYDF